MPSSFLTRPFTVSCRANPAAQTSDPEAVAEAFLAKFASGKQFVSRQFLDANQLRLFSLTLNRRYLHRPGEGVSLEDAAPADGTPVPPLYHLAYFTPAQLPGILGIDGTDTSFNPSAPFTRRMWAGGSVSWPGASSERYLRIGDTVTEVTKVLRCDPKVIKATGEKMIVAGVLKEFWDGRGDICVSERRNWVFREALDPSKPVSPPKRPPLLSAAELNELGRGNHVRTFCRDQVTLFRFSALTFNGHRIHYDKPWAVAVEGHRNVVVHGPLNLVSMLDLWRDEAMGSALAPDKEAVMPQSIEYRATSPVYAGESHRILLDKQRGSDGMTAAKVVSDDGTVCMRGAILNP